MDGLTSPAVSWLYVPGDRPDRFAKAAVSGAHVVIVDLEDAVAARHKIAARANAVAWLRDTPPVAVEVRINARDTEWFDEDLAALGELDTPPVIRLPKTTGPDDVAAVRTVLAHARVSALLESALGVEQAHRIAATHGVCAIGLGEADLAGELGTETEDALAWVRSRVVVAAHAAGLGAPAMSVYPHVSDTDGLATSCRNGRALGLLGRAAIHPRQIDVIHDAFRPSSDQLRRARETLEALNASDGVTTTADGHMVDGAMRRRAETVLRLAARLGSG